MTGRDKEIKVGDTNPYSGPVSAYGAIGKTIQAYWTSMQPAASTAVCLSS